MEHIYDLIIIGAGPAGMGAALYASRACLDTLVIEKNYSAGGQIINTAEVDNYLGLPKTNGFELGSLFKAHAEGTGAEFITDEITTVITEGDVKIIHGKAGNYRAYAVILAMGAHHRKLNIPGEKEYTGKGVSYCATCDGAFFRNRDTTVIGGGDVAVEDAIYLSGICRHVSLVHRRDTLRTSKSLVETLLQKNNVDIIWDCIPLEIQGEESVNKILIKNVKTEKIIPIDTDGVFAAVGMVPETEIVSGSVTLDENGYVVAGEDCATNIYGIYAAGDIRTKPLRQVITAVSDGANAVNSVSKYLGELIKKA